MTWTLFIHTHNVFFAKRAFAFLSLFLEYSLTMHTPCIAIRFFVCKFQVLILTGGGSYFADFSKTGTTTKAVDCCDLFQLRNFFLHLLTFLYCLATTPPCYWMISESPPSKFDFTDFATYVRCLGLLMPAMCSHFSCCFVKPFQSDILVRYRLGHSQHVD